MLNITWALSNDSSVSDAPAEEAADDSEFIPEFLAPNVLCPKYDLHQTFRRDGMIHLATHVGHPRVASPSAKLAFSSIGFNQGITPSSTM